MMFCEPLKTVYVVVLSQWAWPQVEVSHPFMQDSVLTAFHTELKMVLCVSALGAKFAVSTPERYKESMDKMLKSNHNIDFMSVTGELILSTYTN